MFVNNYIFSMVNRTDIELSEFDFMLVRYIWGAGSGNDLDTSTGILNTGNSIDNSYVGYQQTGGSTQEFVPPGTTSSSAYLWYALDNTSGEGTEAVVLGVNNIKNGPATLFNKIKFPIMAHWWSARGTGNIQIELTTYKDGYMGKTGTNIINVGGTLVSTNTLSVNVIQMASSSTALSSFQHIATVDYDITLDKAVIKPHGTPTSFLFSGTSSTNSGACSLGSYINNWYSYDSEVLGTGSVIYTTDALNVTVPGGSSWYKESGTNCSYQIDANGNVLSVFDCSGANLPPNPFTLTAGTSTETSNSFTWTNTGDDVAVISYEIYRNTVLVNTVPGIANSYYENTLTASTVYSYYLKAVDGEGLKTQSNTITMTTSDPVTPPSSLQITATVLSLGTGHIDITGGVPFERIDLTLTLTYYDSLSGFSTLSITAPVVISPVDTLHDVRTGYVDLDASGNATATYTVDASDATFNSILDMTARSSGEPMPAVTSVGISNT